MIINKMKIIIRIFKKIIKIILWLIKTTCFTLVRLLLKTVIILTSTEIRAGKTPRASIEIF